VAAALLVVLVGMPLWELLRAAGEGGWSQAGRTLTTPSAVRAIGHTVEVAAVVTAVALAAGGALAVALHRQLLPGHRALRILLVLPLVVPQFMLAFSWAQAYGPGGLLDDLTGLTLPGLFGPVGIVLVLAVEAVPLAYLAVAAGLAVRAEPDLERAARTAGASAWTAFRTVTLPLLRLPLVAAGALVFAGTVNSFAVPQVLGTPAGYSMMTTFVYQELNLSAAPDAFARSTAMALAMVLLVLLVLGLADLAVGGRAFAARRAGPAGAAIARPPGRVARAVSVLLAGAAALAVVIPLVVVAATAITRGAGLAPVPANWTLDNFTVAFTDEAVAALGRTLGLAVVAAGLATAGGALVVALGGRVRSALGTGVVLGYAVPGSALAVGVLVAYGRWLVGGWLLILVVYLAKFWALGHRPVAAGADRIAPELLLAARASGARAATALRTVVLPLMRPALLTGAGLVFVFALHELTMSSILYGPGSQTFAVVVLNQQQLGNPGATAALALVLTVPPLIVAAGLWLLLRRDRARTSVDGVVG